jgi:hypothetical protein
MDSTSIIRVGTVKNGTIEVFTGNMGTSPFMTVKFFIRASVSSGITETTWTAAVKDPILTAVTVSGPHPGV